MEWMIRRDLGVALAWRSVVVLGVWIVLTGADRGALPAGVLFALLTAALSCRVSPPSGLRIRPVALIRFVPFFIWRSLVGGVDVAWRAYQREPSLAPRFIRYRLDLPPGPPRVLFVLTVSLLPGTLAARLVKDGVWVHCLDGREDVSGALADVESRVGALFGVEDSVGARSA